jgi:O-antigen/teichoic acid export membrane protein
LVFIIFPKKVLLLFGPEYLESAQILIILTIATLIQAFLGAAGPTLSMSGRTKLVLLNTIGAFIINILLNIFLIPQYGIVGAAWATFISLTLIGLIRIVEVGFILKMNFVDLKILKPLVSGIVTYQILYSIKPYIMNYHTLITLGIAGITGLISFGLLIWLLRIEDEDEDFLNGIGIIKSKFVKNEN